MTVDVHDHPSVANQSAFDLREGISFFQADLLATVASASNSTALTLLMGASDHGLSRQAALERLVRISTDPDVGVIDWGTLARVDAEAWGYTEFS
jgi:hypothetical protein